MSNEANHDKLESTKEEMEIKHNAKENDITGSQDQNKKSNVSENIFRKQNQNDKKLEKESNIFTKNTNSINLFNFPTKQVSINLFEKAIAAKPIVENSDNQDAQDKQSQLKKSQQPQMQSQPKQKVMNYKYPPQHNKIKDFNLNRFRNGNNTAKQNIILSLQQKLDNKDMIYLIVKAKFTHVHLYESIITKAISKVQEFMGKKQNAKIEVIGLVKEDNKQKTIRQTLKLQFQNEQDCNEFKNIVNQFITNSK